MPKNALFRPEKYKITGNINTPILCVLLIPKSGAIIPIQKPTDITNNPTRPVNKNTKQISKIMILIFIV